MSKSARSLRSIKRLVATPAHCAGCDSLFTGVGWFCSPACDDRERAVRVVHKLVTGLRAAHVLHDRNG